MKLTKDNYYGIEADKAYWSCSQYQDFETCEARALAKLNGRWKEEPSEAFTVGNYFHTFMEGPDAHREFIEANHDRIYTKQGKIRAAYELADEMIETALNDSFITEWIRSPGEIEKIITGKLFGKYPWKIRLDKYFPHEKRPVIVDWKTVADIYKKEWNEETRERESFVRRYGYLFRAAIYLEIEKQAAGRETDAEFFLVCISKQDPPDKAIVALTGSSRQELDYELEKVREKLWRFDAIKRGELPAKRCGHCDYCRQTKSLDAAHIIHYTDLDPGAEGGEEYEKL